jgi:RHS repeat-associated protein
MGNVRHYYQFKASGKTVTGQLVASYEYDAFGREVRAWGTNTPVTSQPPGLPASRPWADLLPFHYSSKLRDADSGFNYYGYRFYDPGAGRWLNRDPIEEAGGVNLYGIVGNDGVNTFDHLGLKGCKVKSLKVSELDRNNPINDDGSRNYTPIEPGTSATPIPVTGTPRKRANLRVDAEFEKPDCGCCEVRQKVRKGKNAPLKEDTGEGAAADGFKGSEGAYGHRNQAGVPGFDTYYNQRNKYGDAIPNKSGGSKYESTDKPSPGRNEGVWTFVIEVIDTCNGNKVVDMTDFSIDWSK